MLEEKNETMTHCSAPLATVVDRDEEGGVVLWKRLLILIATIVVSFVALNLLFGFLATDDVPPPPQVRLTEASMSRRPFWHPSERGTIILRGTGEIAGDTWLLTAVGSSTQISFRQAAVVNLQLIGNVDVQPDAATYSVDESTVVCVEMNASTFDVNGPEHACARLGILPRSWAWTLIPKEGIAGVQTVAIALGLESLTKDSSAAETEPLPMHHVTRFLTIDVKKTLFERFLPYMTATIAAVAVIAAAFIGLFKRS
jgi:hypothetical protein